MSLADTLSPTLLPVLGPVFFGPYLSGLSLLVTQPRNESTSISGQNKVTLTFSMCLAINDSSWPAGLFKLVLMLLGEGTFTAWWSSIRCGNRDTKLG